MISTNKALLGLVKEKIFGVIFIVERSSKKYSKSLSIVISIVERSIIIYLNFDDELCVFRLFPQILSLVAKYINLKMFNDQITVNNSL